MSNFFYADKANRNAAFHFANDTALDSEVNGDQASRLHPVPANLGNSQKVPMAGHEPAPQLNPIEQPRTFPQGSYPINAAATDGV